MAKINGLRGWLIFAVSAGIVLVSASGGYYTLRTDAKASAEIRKIMSDRIDINTTNIMENKLDVVIMQNDIKYIKDAIDKNTTIQQEILKEIRK